MKTHECPFCGDIFEANIKPGTEKAGDENNLPPCLSCAFEGKEPITPEQKLKMELTDEEG